MILYYLAISFFLILGLLNPVKGSWFDTFIGFFVFGLVSYAVIGKSRCLLTVLTVLAWIIFTVINSFEFTVIIGSLSGVGLSYVFDRFKVLERFVIWIIIVAFLASSIAAGGALRAMLSRSLPLYTYNNDPGVFLETYQLMEQNNNYYESFRIALLGRFDQQILPGDIWGWRLPTLFLIWRYLPGTSGLTIYFLYLVAASLMLYLSFRIGIRYLGNRLGVLSGYLIFPYLHFAGRDQMLLETEWWPVILFVAGVYMLIKNRFVFAMLLFLFAVWIRELYVLPLVLMLIYSLFKKRSWLSVFLVPLLGFLILFSVHIRFVSQYLGLADMFTFRTVSNGFLAVQKTLAFASWEYLLYTFRPFVIFVIAAVFGCRLIYKKFGRNEAVVWLLAFLPFPIAFLKFGAGIYNDYWGIVYMPPVLILAPVAIGFLLLKGD